MTRPQPTAPFFIAKADGRPIAVKTGIRAGLAEQHNKRD